MYNCVSMVNRLKQAKAKGEIEEYQLTVTDGDNIQSFSSIMSNELEIHNKESCNHVWYVTTRLNLEDCVPVICAQCGMVACACQLVEGFNNVPFQRFPQNTVLSDQEYLAGEYYGNYIYDCYYGKKVTKKDNVLHVDFGRQEVD